MNVAAYVEFGKFGGGEMHVVLLTVIEFSRRGVEHAMATQLNRKAYLHAWTSRITDWVPVTQ